MMTLFKGIHNGQKFFVMNLVINLDRKKITKTKTNWMKKKNFFGLWEYDT